MEDHAEVLVEVRSLKGKAKDIILAIPLLGQSVTPDKLHSDALDILLQLADLEKKLENIGNKGNYSGSTQTSNAVKMTQEDSISEEIEKVARKLPKWARNPNQINTKILTLYLKLVDQGIDHITEEILMAHYGNDSEFYRNFSQMKIASPKNHGKIFETSNGVIEIWEPVRGHVAKFKSTVL